MTAASLSEARRRLRSATDPTVVVLAGSNGAGKSTFYEHFLAGVGLPFINADFIARELDPEEPGKVAYQAAQLADRERRALVARKASFCMETVFSDPVGDKVGFLKDAQKQGYSVFLIFIGLPSVELSIARVIQRTGVGGHDVPDEKLVERFPRTLENLRKAIPFVDLAIVFDNGSASEPYRHVVTFEHGKRVAKAKSIPAWASALLRV